MFALAANAMLAQAKRLLRPGTLLVGDITVPCVGGRNSGVRAELAQLIAPGMRC